MANGTIQLRMDEFLGINQTRGEQMDMRYATWAENIDTRHGRFSTARGYQHVEDVPTDDHEGGIVRITNHSVKHSEWFKDLMLVCCKTKMFARLNSEDGAYWELVSNFNNADIQGNSVDSLIYEDLSQDFADKQADVLIVSSQSNGLEFYEISDAVPHVKQYKTDDTIKDLPKFGALAQYNERIFGTGSKEYPDRIHYSAAFNPMDWGLNNEIPENGGGFIDYPTWDGDSFIALVPFGADLLAFKRNSLCVLSGTYPGEYTIYKTFGTEGPIAKNTICVYRNMVFFLTTSGIGVYDGSSIRTISRDALYWVTVNLQQANTEVASAIIKDGVYMCSVCINGSIPDAVIEYDIERDTYMLRTGLSVTAWCRNVYEDWTTFLVEKDLFIAVSSDPYGIYEYGHSLTYNGEPIHAVWESPFTDAGHKEAIKSAFRVYALPEDNGVEIEDFSNRTVDFSIVTERKTKTKKLKAQMFYDEKKKMLSKSVSNKGRQFKLKIESDIPFIIQTGIQLQAELDSD